jgi:hypothetical protein
MHVFIDYMKRVRKYFGENLNRQLLAVVSTMKKTLNHLEHEIDSTSWIQVMKIREGWTPPSGEVGKSER